ncbi:MAG: response regulator [Helicobacter sp.]|nr:response regulator [Helicobacter sp.]MDE5816455.1 response regulator [Helicobacter sp.]MDE6043986.1 response regulator [Helicobacter sp.]MDE7196229.1 response regulator [Helicobacter sp.]
MKNLFDLRLLYVEDDEQAQLVMQRILKRRFADIVSAKDGQEALDVFLKGNVDIAIVDMNIPLLNGLELCMRIRETNEDMPIMMITAFDQSDCLLKALEIGVDRFLFKPINMEILDRQLKILARRAILFKQALGVVV